MQYPPIVEFLNALGDPYKEGPWPPKATGPRKVNVYDQCLEIGANDGRELNDWLADALIEVIWRVIDPDRESLAHPDLYRTPDPEGELTFEHVVHAWRLLGLGRVAGAVPVLIEAMLTADVIPEQNAHSQDHADAHHATPREKCEHCGTDVVVEFALSELPEALAMIGAPALPEIRRTFEGGIDVDEMAGAVAMCDALARMVQRHPALEDEIADLRRDLIERHIDHLPTELLSTLIVDAAESGDPLALPPIIRAFSRGLVDPEIVDWQGILRCYNGRAVVPVRVPENRNPSLPSTWPPPPNLGQPEYLGDELLDGILRSAGSLLKAEQVRMLIIGLLLSPFPQTPGFVMRWIEASGVDEHGLERRALGKMASLTAQVTAATRVAARTIIRGEPLPDFEAEIIASDPEAATSQPVVQTVIGSRLRPMLTAFLEGVHMGALDRKLPEPRTEHGRQLKRLVGKVWEAVEGYEAVIADRLAAGKASTPEEESQTDLVTAARLRMINDGLITYWNRNFRRVAEGFVALRSTEPPKASPQAPQQV